VFLIFVSSTKSDEFDAARRATCSRQACARAWKCSLGTRRSQSRLRIDRVRLQTIALAAAVSGMWWEGQACEGRGSDGAVSGDRAFAYEYRALAAQAGHPQVGVFADVKSARSAPELDNPHGRLMLKRTTPSCGDRAHSTKLSARCASGC